MFEAYNVEESEEIDHEYRHSDGFNIIVVFSEGRICEQVCESASNGTHKVAIYKLSSPEILAIQWFCL